MFIFFALLYAIDLKKLILRMVIQGDTKPENIMIFDTQNHQKVFKMIDYGSIEPFQNPSFNNPKTPLKYNTNIPHFLENIILRAITTDTEKRYKNYSELII